MAMLFSNSYHLLLHLIQPVLDAACKIPNRIVFFISLGLAKGVGMNAVWESNG